MDIQIRETGEKHALFMTRASDGVEYAQDFIGHTGALRDGQFKWAPEAGAFLCNQCTYEWWQDVCAAHEELENRITNLCQEYGSKAVYEVVDEAADCDLEDQPANIHGALDMAFGVEESSAPCP